MEYEKDNLYREGDGSPQRFWIKVDNKFIEVTSGLIWDSTSKKYIPLDFFYLSKADRMINIEFDAILTQLSPPPNNEIVSYNLNNVISRVIEQKSLDTALLLKNVDALKNQVYKLTESVESYKKQFNLLQKSNNKNILNGGSPSKRKKTSRELSKDSLLFRRESDVESLDHESIPLSRLKSTPLKKHQSTLTCRIQHAEVESSSSVSRETDIGSEISPVPQVARNVKIHIHKNTINVIERWFEKNEAMVRRLYRLKTDKRRGIDDKSFNKLLTYMNPLVTLVKLSKYTVESYKKKHYSPLDKAVERKEVFARNLGLRRRSTLDRDSSVLSPRSLRSMDNVPKLRTSIIKESSQESVIRRKLSFTPNKIREPSTSSDEHISLSSYSSIIDYSSPESSNQQRKYSKRQVAVEKKSTPKPTNQNGNKNRNNVLSPVKGNSMTKNQNDDNSKPSQRSSFGRNIHKVIPESEYVKDKTQYSTREDEIILKWVLEGARSTLVNGNTIWKQLEDKKLMPSGGRKWQSLRQRYLKTILSQLRNYGLSYQEEMQLKVGAMRGSIKRVSKIYKENTAALSKPSKPKLLTNLKDYNHYKKEDILNDGTVKMNFKDFKAQQKRKSTTGARKLFTQESFIVMASQNSSSIAMK